ncbi:MAG: DUF2064 domain-containing protein [Deinococcales bacterium]|nr:DUF2064 domain-containing protein [Chitinophagaceae bacterium]
MENKTAILFFARTAATELRHKKLCNKNIIANTRLHSFLYKKTLSEIYKTKLPVIICHEHKQMGNDFGSRYNNAIKNCFSKGYSSVIAIGSDCPQLKAVDILYSHYQLAKGNNVLGPDNRGGIYLMGIQQNQFLNIDLKNIKWHSSGVLSQLQTSLKQVSAKVCLLNKLMDVNSEKDILQLINQYAKNVFIKILQAIIFNISLTFPNYFNKYKQLSFLTTSTFRGPPALLLI